jgi:hypothetical protein
MRLTGVVGLLSLLPLWAQAPDEKDAIAAVQKLFDGMAAHNTAGILAVLAPECRLYSVRDEAAPVSRSGEDFAKQLGTLKGEILEKFTSAPSVSIRGRMAQVWGEYEFSRDGKFSHCGVDSVSLLKTPEGWKIATIVYTVETRGCKGH